MDFERIYILLKTEELVRAHPNLSNILAEVRDELGRINDGHGPEATEGVTIHDAGETEPGPDEVEEDE